MKINGNLFSAILALAQLDMEVSMTKGHSVKESTKKNLLSQLGSYEKFCNQYMLNYFPCDNLQLCRFRQYLSRTFKSPDAVGELPIWN